MNYRHRFHAGNFADVFKHILLTRILAYLLKKETALRYIDTHAGTGLYDLASTDAMRTREWAGGIARLAAALPLTPAPVKELLAAYLHALGPFNASGRPHLYTGSPAIAQAMLRNQDRMTFCELHREDVKTLETNIGRDRRAKTIAIDGYIALNAYVPPVERRGLVFIDPPFEDASEFETLGSQTARAWAKWPTGVFGLWYPLKEGREGELLAGALAQAGVRRGLRLELFIDNRARADAASLPGCGLLVINPPFSLAAEARLLLAHLAQTLAPNGAGSWKISTFNND